MMQFALPALLLVFTCQLSPVSAQTSYTPINPNTQPAEQTSLTNNRALWSSYNFQNYAYTYDKQCHICCWSNSCAASNYPWTVQVNTDTYTTYNQYTGVKAIDSKDGAVTSGMKSIDQMFDELQMALNDPNKLIEVTYDDCSWAAPGSGCVPYGYPTVYRIQTGTGDSMSFDEVRIYNEIEYAASQLTSYNNANTAWIRSFSRLQKNYIYEFFDTSSNAVAGSYPFRVTVTNGVVTQVQDKGGTYLSNTYGTTIDDLLYQIGRQIDSNAPYIQNSYDSSWGYPIDIVMVPAANTVDYTYGNAQITYFTNF